MLNPRTRCREIALQLLYMADQNESFDSLQAQRFIARRLRDRRLHEVVIELVDGVQSHQEEIDALLAKLAVNWRLDRMAAIDRNVLRVGAHEMLHCPSIPPKVAINEAVEIAKRYSTAQSSRFVNGILHQIYQNHLPGGPPPDAEDVPAVPVEEGIERAHPSEIVKEPSPSEIVEEAPPEEPTAAVEPEVEGPL